MAEIRDHILWLLPRTHSTSSMTSVTSPIQMWPSPSALATAWNNTREDIIVMFPICNSYMGGVIVLI